MMVDGFVCMLNCKVCGAEKLPFTVRWRESTEDIVAYVDKVVRPAMAAAHMKFQPRCPSPHCDLMMPVDEGAKGIGMRTVN
jgi:hypothetical protein